MWLFSRDPVRDFPFELGPPEPGPDPQPGPAPLWKLLRGRRKADGQAVSVFVHALGGGDPEGSARARCALRRLRTLRHPNVLGYIDSLETEQCLYLVTEAVTPLRCRLRDPGGGPSEEEVAWGLHQLLTALAFLYRSGLVHGALGLDAVFVDPGGEWKLGGLERVGASGEEPPPPPPPPPRGAPPAPGPPRAQREWARPRGALGGGHVAPGLPHLGALQRAPPPARGPAQLRQDPPGAGGPVLRAGGRRPRGTAGPRAAPGAGPQPRGLPRLRAGGHRALPAAAPGAGPPRPPRLPAGAAPPPGGAAPPLPAPQAAAAAPRRPPLRQRRRRRPRPPAQGGQGSGPPRVPGARGARPRAPLRRPRPRAAHAAAAAAGGLHRVPARGHGERPNLPPRRPRLPRHQPGHPRADRQVHGAAGPQAAGGDAWPGAAAVAVPGAGGGRAGPPALQRHPLPRAPRPPAAPPGSAAGAGPRPGAGDAGPLRPGAGGRRGRLRRHPWVLLGPGVRRQGAARPLRPHRRPRPGGPGAGVPGDPQLPGEAGGGRRERGGHGGGPPQCSRTPRGRGGAGGGRAGGRRVLGCDRRHLPDRAAHGRRGRDPPGTPPGDPPGDPSAPPTRAPPPRADPPRRLRPLGR